MFAAVLPGLLGVGALAVILLLLEAFRHAGRLAAARLAARRAARRPPPVSVPPAVAGRRG
jgi:hypothetical protein